MLFIHRIIRASILVFVFVFFLKVFFNVFNFKFDDGIVNTKTYFKQPKDSIDVLFLGSSHAFCNINPTQLYDEHGIASYIIGGSVMPLWNEYYWLVEALKYQKPKMVMIEAGILTINSEILDTQRIIKNTYGLPIKSVQTLLHAMRVSSYADDIADYFLQFSNFHSRYNVLNVSDYDDMPSQSSQLKGYYPMTHVSSQEKFNIESNVLPIDLTAKSETYLRKIIELCRSNNIEFEIFLSPYPGYNGYDASIFKKARSIVNEYGVAFTDFNDFIDDIDFDYGIDFADSVHMNDKGVAKFSAYLGNTLSKKYELPDRRNQTKWQSWADGWSLYKQRILNEHLLENGGGCDAILEEIAKNPYYTTVIKPVGMIDIANPAAQHVMSFFPNAILVGDTYLFDRGGHIDMMGTDFVKMKSVLSNVIDISLDNFKINGTDAKKVTRGVNVAIYDGLTERMVCNFGIDDELKLVK